MAAGVFLAWVPGRIVVPALDFADAQGLVDPAPAVLVCDDLLLQFIHIPVALGLGPEFIDSLLMGCLACQVG